MERHKESEGSFDLELEKKSDLPLSEREEKVSKLLEKAKELREQGNYDQGKDKLLNALELEAKKDKVYYRLGNIFFDAGDIDRAEYAYKRAIEENKEHVNAQHNLAVVYRKQGRIDESVKQRKKANKIEVKNPKDPDLTEEEKGYAKWLALKLMLLILVGVLGFGLFVYLIVVFLV